MTSGLKVVIDGWWWPQVFPDSFSKCSAWLPYVFILAVHPTTLVPIHQWVMYRYKCCRVDCKDEYIGESGRTFAERVREHLRPPSPIYDHFKTTGHEVSLDNFSIVGRDDQSMTRTIREAMLIRVNDPSLNRNMGKYQLPHIWDEVLVRSPEMQLK